MLIKWWRKKKLLTNLIWIAKIIFQGLLQYMSIGKELESKRKTLPQRTNDQRRKNQRKWLNGAFLSWWKANDRASCGYFLGHWLFNRFINNLGRDGVYVGRKQAHCNFSGYQDREEREVSSEFCQNISLPLFDYFFLSYHQLIQY